jgi:hypothetical protein
MSQLRRPRPPSKHNRPKGRALSKTNRRLFRRSKRKSRRRTRKSPRQFRKSPRQFRKSPRRSPRQFKSPRRSKQFRKSKPRKCPHPAFTDKHFCSWCQDARDATYFSLISRGTGIKGGKIFTNTVLCGERRPVEFLSAQDKYCINKKPIKAFQCTGLGRAASVKCSSLGNITTISDKSKSGHLIDFKPRIKFNRRTK